MDKFFTVQEIAEILKVSKVWIYKLAQNRVIPSYRIGREKRGSIRFSSSDLEEFLKTRRRSSKA